MGIAKTRNKWINSKGIRSFIFESRHNNQSVYSMVQQCRCDYDEDKHNVVMNYVIDNWINEYHTPFLLRRWILEHTNTSKCLCTVENLYAVQKTQTSRIQLLWLSQTEPEPDLLLNLEKYIKTLPDISPMSQKDMNRYHKKVYGDTVSEETEVTKHYVTNTDEIKNLIENGLL